ncbi:MAG: SRPBCC family protein, partial [Chloroflexi bacterium]|nr:SRPBCC family protein [Chloroflexota bacterium]
MPHREFHYHWQWQLQASPEELWPLVADTNRFDRDTGLPSVENVPGQPLANARRRLRLARFGVPLEWVEEPVEWVEPHHFAIVRNYSRGPVGQLRVLVQLIPQEASTRLVYQVWARPRNLLGYLAIPAQIGVLSARRFPAIFHQYDRLVMQKRAALDLPGQKPHFAPAGETRLQALTSSLKQEGARPALVERLVWLVAQADDLTIFRLRPYLLADYWQEPRRETLELFLLATRLGLLDFRWDLLCPLCRVAKDSNPTLAGVTRQVHCDTCNIDYTANFERSVELSFRPNPAIRLVDENLQFCTSGPRAMPHVVAQQRLDSGTSAVLTLSLESGRYRLRALNLSGAHFLQVVSDEALASSETTIAIRR